MPEQPELGLDSVAIDDLMEAARWASLMFDELHEIAECVPGLLACEQQIPVLVLAGKVVKTEACAGNLAIVTADLDEGPKIVLACDKCGAATRGSIGVQISGADLQTIHRVLGRIPDIARRLAAPWPPAS